MYMFSLPSFPLLSSTEKGEKGKKPHPDVGDSQQRLALHFLQQQGLVPEHIETRNLYTPMQPNISQVSHVTFRNLQSCDQLNTHTHTYTHTHTGPAACVGGLVPQQWEHPH